MAEGCVMIPLMTMVAPQAPTAPVGLDAVGDGTFRIEFDLADGLPSMPDVPGPDLSGADMSNVALTLPKSLNPVDAVVDGAISVTLDEGTSVDPETEGPSPEMQPVLSDWVWLPQMPALTPTSAPIAETGPLVASGPAMPRIDFTESGQVAEGAGTVIAPAMVVAFAPYALGSENGSNMAENAPARTERAISGAGFPTVPVDVSALPNGPKVPDEMPRDPAAAVSSGMAMALGNRDVSKTTVPGRYEMQQSVDSAEPGGSIVPKVGQTVTHGAQSTFKASMPGVVSLSPVAPPLTQPTVHDETPDRDTSPPAPELVIQNSDPAILPAIMVADVIPDLTPASLDALPVGRIEWGASLPLAAAAHPAAPQQTLPQTLPAELAQIAAQRPDGPVDLLLNPEDLGRLRFEMTQSPEGLRVVLSIEQPETLDLVRRHAEQFLTELRQAGFGSATLSFGQWGSGSHKDHPPTPDDDVATVTPVRGEQTYAPPPVPQKASGLNLRL
jgi:hypothetical protein